MLLAFLHGFLGSSADWREVAWRLKVPFVALDLPGHGGRPFTPDIERELLASLPNPAHLVGYSMGGRLALAFALKHPEKIASLTLLSTHLGLKTEDERKKRKAADEMWAKKILEQPIDQFLREWYDQPLFHPLRLKMDVLSLRMKQNPGELARALLAFSLANQPDFSDQLHVLEGKLSFLVGEEDPTYRSLYADRPHHLIAGAGHAIHLENPKAVATFLSRRVPCLL